MNRRSFLKSVAPAAPLIFIPQLIKPVWGILKSNIEVGQDGNIITITAGMPEDWTIGDHVFIETGHGPQHGLVTEKNGILLLPAHSWLLRK